MLGKAPTTNERQPHLILPADGAKVGVPFIARCSAPPQAAPPPYSMPYGRLELEVQRFGGWASIAHRTYINTSDTRGVNRALIHAITEHKYSLGRQYHELNLIINKILII